MADFPEWKRITCDIETDEIVNGRFPRSVTCVWVAVVTDIPTGEHLVFRRPDMYVQDDRELLTINEDHHAFQAILDTADEIWGHNIVKFDAPVLRRLCGFTVEHHKLRDTLIMSRLGNYNRKGGHSMEALGRSMGEKKGSFNDWSQLSEEMITYCIQDNKVQAKMAKVFTPMTKDPKWKDAIEIEHLTEALLEEMHVTGFPFNEDKARTLMSEITGRMGHIEDRFKVTFPPKEEQWKTLQYKKTKDGELYATVKRAMGDASRWEKVGEDLVCYHMVPFNPGSSRHRIDRLNEAGWSPVDKTDGHRDHIRGGKRLARLMGEEAYQEKLEHYEKYGWKCNEENLSTLNADAPKETQELAEWLVLEGRRSALQEWLDKYNPNTGRIHGEVTCIGAWTGRCAHSKPNTANIASEFHGNATTPVERVKEAYDGRMRECWEAAPGKVLVGTDAEGIQLRILAHLMKSDEYVQAIIHGKKEDETDIHNVNRKALGLDHVTRDMAKTFIYAFLLGAGTGKVAEILQTDSKTAKQSVDNFTRSIEGLSELKGRVIPMCAQRGYFLGLDGRKVMVPGEHWVLAGMLQNGESVIMKYAKARWTQQARDEGIDYELHNFVHDEWQTSCPPDQADRLGELQRESIVWAGVKLGVFCPLAGSTDIGNNWRETH